MPCISLTPAHLCLWWQDSFRSPPAAGKSSQSQPTLNEFARTRAQKRGRTSSRTTVRKTKNPTKVSVEQRLHEFPGETLCKSAGILFCRCCKQTLPTIKSSIIVHRDSTKHKENKIEYAVPLPLPRAPHSRKIAPHCPHGHASRLTPRASHFLTQGEYGTPLCVNARVPIYLPTRTLPSPLHHPTY